VKKLKVIIQAENLSECFSELKQEQENMFLYLSQKIVDKNKARGEIQKGQRVFINFSFRDKAER